MESTASNRDAGDRQVRATVIALESVSKRERGFQSGAAVGYDSCAAQIDLQDVNRGGQRVRA